MVKSTQENKVSSGYKQTEVGLIPDEWDLISFDQAFEFLRTASYSREQLGSGGDVRYIHYGDIHTRWNHFVDMSDSSIPTIDRDKAGKYSQIRDGDLVIADASEDYEGIGKSIEVTNLGVKKAISGLHTFLLRDKGNCFADGFKGYINSNPFVKRSLDRYATGLKVYGISKGNFKLIQIPKPPIPEQSAIVATLRNTTALIESLEKLIAKKRAIKQGTMQELLTGKRRLSGFSGKWSVKQLGMLGQFRGGNGFPVSYQGNMEGDYPFYKVSDMNNEGNSTFMSTSNNWVSEKTLKVIGAKTFPENTIVFAKIGAAIFLERKRLLSQDSCIDNNMMGMVLNEEQAHYRFVYYMLLNIRLGQFVSATALPSLNGRELSQLKYNVPSVPEQMAVVEVIADMDVELETLERRLTKHKFLMQGMMQALLTGKIRLLSK